MEQENSRVALLGIIISDIEASNQVNKILHEYSDFILGRMGIPYRKRICPGNFFKTLKKPAVSRFRKTED